MSWLIAEGDALEQRCRWALLRTVLRRTTASVLFAFAPMSVASCGGSTRGSGSESGSSGGGAGAEAGRGGEASGGESNAGRGGAGEAGRAGSELGESCLATGALACAGEHQKLKLVCGASGRWETNGTCGSGDFCQTSSGVDAGVCLPEAEECRGKAPSANVCLGDELRKCGRDALDSSLVENCANGCEAGACRTTAECKVGFGNCDAAPDCETDVTSSVLHCGACSHACIGEPNTLETCVAGKCACKDGFGDCSMAVGCETGLQADPKNCGACGRVCASGECVAGECSTRVFVTSQGFNGNLGGLTGADEKCQAAADGAALGGKFAAWLGDSKIDAQARLVHSTSPYRLLNGQMIGKDWQELTEHPKAGVDIDESGSVTPGSSSAYAWTGYGASDVGGYYCDDWTSNDPAGRGLVGKVGLNFRGAYRLCGLELARLYCFEVHPSR